MKNTLTALLALISLSAFAGDKYFVCENEQNEDFLSATLNNGKARLMLTVKNDPYLLDVKEVKSAKENSYILKITTLRVQKSEKVELDLFEEIQLGPYVCLMRD
jgi:hypothetical protein